MESSSHPTLDDILSEFLIPASHSDNSPVNQSNHCAPNFPESTGSFIPQTPEDIPDQQSFDDAGGPHQQFLSSENLNINSTGTMPEDAFLEQFVFTDSRPSRNVEPHMNAELMDNTNGELMLHPYPMIVFPCMCLLKHNYFFIQQRVDLIHRSGPVCRRIVGHGFRATWKFRLNEKAQFKKVGKGTRRTNS